MLRTDDTGSPPGLSSLRSDPQVRIVRTLQARGMLSRAELARSTGLAKSTVSAAVAQLLTEGVLVEPGEELPPADKSGGRPASGVALNPRAGVCVGIDFGYRTIRAAAVDLSHSILATRSDSPGPGYGPKAGLETAAHLMQQVLDEAQVPASRVLGVGAAVPGPVDPRTGSVARSSMIPSWAGTVVREELENVFAYPVTVDNDSNCAALAEMRWGAGRGYRNVVYLKLHSGIGGAIVLNGELLHGNSGRAGEFGHITLDPRGPLCGCGNRGCLETYAGIPALLEQARPSYGPQLTLTELLQLARRGDTGCRRLLTDTGHLVGQALGSLWNTLDPEVIIIGGALSRAQDLLLEPTRDGFLRTALSPGTGTESRILMGTLGGNASALGAVVSFFKGIVEMALPSSAAHPGASG